jgi:hypothetical protein
MDGNTNTVAASIALSVQYLFCLPFYHAFNAFTSFQIKYLPFTQAAKVRRQLNASKRRITLYIAINCSF